MASSERQSIENAIKDLGHHDPASRLTARQVLIAHEASSLPLIQQSLEDAEKLAANYYQELVRVRDWIIYGEDPERLYELIQAVDLRRIPHGNMFGGMAGAIENAPQFKELIDLGQRVLPFLQAVLENDENSYSIRAAAAMMVEEIGSVRYVPKLIAMLEHEHRILDGTGQEVLKLEEKYRGFFLAAVHQALRRLTGEYFLRGFFQAVFSGIPEVLYNVSLSGLIIQCWRDWWEKMGPQIESGKDLAELEADKAVIEKWLNDLSESKDKHSYARYALNRLGAKADQAVVDFMLSRPAADSVTSLLIEMLIQNRRGSSLPEGQHTGELIAAWLMSFDDTLFLRDAVMRSYAQLPASMLHAISIVLPIYVLGREHPHLFNPFIITGLETPGERENYSETATEEIIAGLLSTDTVTRHLFFDIAQGAAAQVSSRAKQQTSADGPPNSLIERLLQIRDSFTNYDDRVALMRVLESGGIEPELGEVLTTLREAPAESNTESLADLVRLISGKKIPEAMRSTVMQQLFVLVKTQPSLSRVILRILHDLEPEYFTYSPAIGERGVSALVRIYELINGSAEAPDKEKLISALREFREDVHEFILRSPFLHQYLGANDVGFSRKFARRFELHGELYDSLLHEASVLAQIELISSSDFETFKKGLHESPGFEYDYLKCLSDEETPTTYDQAACLFEEAARVAAENNLGRDKILMAQLSIADMAGKAKRYEYAEEIYLRLDLKETDSRNFVEFQKHFYGELLVRQGRWADARDLALELRKLYSQEEQLTPEQSHFFYDTYLHEFFCCCRFENVNQAITFLDLLITNYQKLEIVVHWAEVMIEAGSIWGKFGLHELTVQQFRNIHAALPDDPRVGHKRLTALAREAAYFLSVGKTENALDLLEQARLYWETLPSLENRPYERVAEIFWLLGQAHLMNGDAERSNQALTQLRAWSDSQLVQIYRARLQAKIGASFGSIAAAITTLQEAVDLPRTKAYPDLRVELCLDLSDLLILEGFHDRCLEVLKYAYEIASESRNPHLMASIRIMEARVLENTGDIVQAGLIYRDLVSSDQAGEIPDLATVASLSIFSLFAAYEENINLANDIERIKDKLLAIQNVRWRINSLQRFARMYLLNNRAYEADFMLDVLDEEIKTGIPLNIVLECKMLRGQSARINGRADEAVSYFREAVNILEVVHSSVLERGLGAGFFVSKDWPYRALVQALVESGSHSEALHYVERAKTRLFLDQIHWRVINNYDETSPLVRYLQILKRLAFLELDHGKPDTKARRDERTVLEKDLETLRASILEKDLIAAVYPVLGNPTDTQRDLNSVLSAGME